MKNSINLIPKKSDKEYKSEKDIEYSAIYSAFLPILACIVWIGLVIANNVVSQNLKNVENNIDQLKRTLVSLNVYQRNNGQLFKKVEILKPIIEKDVDPNKVFEQVRKNLSTYKEILTISGYSRKSDGLFSFTGTSRTYLEVARVIKKFEENPELKDVNLKSFTYDENKKVITFTVTFFYKNLEEQKLDGTNG